VGGRPVPVSPPIPPTFLINGLDGGGGGPPGGGLVQADADAFDVEEEEDAPPLVRGPGGPKINQNHYTNQQSRHMCLIFEPKCPQF
jgi:hypothetical protein